MPKLSINIILKSAAKTLLLIGISFIPLLSHAEPANAPDKIRAALEELNYGKGKIELLSVTYDDLNGHNAGIRHTVRGTGVVEVKSRNRATGHTRMAMPPEIKKLVVLLIKENAWNQGNIAQPVSDQNIAKLIITYDKDSSTIWEPFTNMTADNRIVKIHNLMQQITGMK